MAIRSTGQILQIGVYPQTIIGLQIARMRFPAIKVIDVNSFVPFGECKSVTDRYKFRFNKPLSLLDSVRAKAFDS